MINIMYINILIKTSYFKPLRDVESDLFNFFLHPVLSNFVSLADVLRYSHSQLFLFTGSGQ